MVDLKTIRSVKIVPYTLITSSIAAVWGLIFAILFIIFAGIASAFIPSSAGIGNVLGVFAALSIALIIVLPVYSFIANIMPAFLLTLIYNLLVPRLGGIQLKLEDLRHIKEIPIVPLALITSAIAAIFTFILALIYAPMLGVQLAVIPLATGASNFVGWGILGIIATVILGPIMVFILTFIIMALSTLIYNFLVHYIGGIKLNFENIEGAVFNIVSIEIVPFALITSAVATVWGLIAGLILMILALIGGSALAGIISLIGAIVITFIIAFIFYAITAFLYNFLAPRIGGIKLELW